MKWLTLLALAPLAACGQSASEKAEAQYRIVSESKLSTNGDLCRVANEVADTFLKEGNQEKYELWQLHAGASCGRKPSELAKS